MKVPQVRVAAKFAIRMAHEYKLALRTSLLKFLRMSDRKRWSPSASLSENWDERMAIIARLIPDGAPVLEFGAGRMVLKQYLKPGTVYTPSDIVDRGPGTIVCDLNAEELPKFARHDVVVFAGVLEYIFDVPRLIAHLVDVADVFVFSYAITDSYGVRRSRRRHGWVNDYSSADLDSIFASHKMVCDREDTWDGHRICRFVKSAGL